jgi:hypothetical protein
MTVKLSRTAPVEFLSQAYAPGDWIAVFVKLHQSGRTTQRVVPVERVARESFLSWLRAENAAGACVYVSINTLRPAQRSRTRGAVADIRHVFVDVDADLEHVLGAMRLSPALPAPSTVIHTSCNRGHVLWRVKGFTIPTTEALQRYLAQELGTDRAAVACSQLTRLPGFRNHKNQPPSSVWAEYAAKGRVYMPADFPRPPLVVPGPRARAPRAPTRLTGSLERARRYMRRVRPAIAGQRGDAHTFRVCCRLVRGFGLDDDEAFAILNSWNKQCVPPWSERELRAKLDHARRYGREPIGGFLAPP